MADLYKYIEWTRTLPDTNGQKTKWLRARISDMEKIREQYHNYGLYTTIQQFKNDKREEGEYHIAPIYFDLDFKEDINVALEDCRKVVEYFQGQFDFSKEHIRIHFSGSKGFHITVTSALFGIRPHPELTYIIKNSCKYISEFLHLRSFDKVVYSYPRMWRLLDSLHEKTGLHCVELDHSELFSKDIQEIRDLALAPRGSLWSDEEYENVEKNSLADLWFLEFREAYERQKELSNLRPKHTLKIIQGEDPVCVQDITSNSIRKMGTRNQAEMALASYYKDIGVDQHEAIRRIVDWAVKIPKDLTTMHNSRNLEANVRSVVDTVFGKGETEKGAENRYHFTCAYIRALGAGTDKPVACLHDKCKFVNPDDQEPEAPIDLKLSEASKAVYIGKRIQTTIMVAGKDEAPYGIPEKIRVLCKPDLTRDNSVCLGCGIAGAGGNYGMSFSAKNKLLLSLLDTSELQQKQVLRRTMGIPDRCNKHKLEVLEHGNVVEILAIPRIDFRPENITDEEEYVYRKCFYVGHDLTTNKEYSASGYTYPEPKTQHLVHVFDTVIPLADDVARFDPDPQALENLKKFQISDFDAVIRRNNGTSS